MCWRVHCSWRQQHRVCIRNETPSVRFLRLIVLCSHRPASDIITGNRTQNRDADCQVSITVLFSKSVNLFFVINRTMWFLYKLTINIKHNVLGEFKNIGAIYIMNTPR